jgi:hypothetical protein
MKQEAKGKIFVGMIVSIVAFGFATGTGFLLGANPLNSQGVLNLTQQSQFPSIPYSNTNNTVQNSQANTTQSSSSSSSNVVTPTNPNTSDNSSSNTPSSNKSSNSSG